MEGFIKAFIRSSLLWFLLGIVIGLVMVAYPALATLRPAHAHANVAGFVSMLIFGVGYQLLPRLFGHPLHSTRLAVVHLWCANAGLAGLVGGFGAQPFAPAAGRWITLAGGILFATGVGLWVYNLWRTFDAADARQRMRESGGGRPLPVRDSY